jgi:1-acyl-sn-glycerol-3-phosphate acyltransferase
MNYFKGILLLVLMLLVGTFWMLMSLVIWVYPRGWSYLNRGFLQSFSLVCRTLLGLKIEFINEERIRSRRPAVLVGNHQTALDLAIIGSICPVRTVIVAKKSIQYIPLFGWFFKIAGNLLIDRSKTSDAKRMMTEVQEKLIRDDLNLTIFPEGTRNRSVPDPLTGVVADLLPFKKGAFLLAADLGLPVIPVVCSSLRGKAIWENFELSGGLVLISVLPIVETKGLDSNQVNELREKIWVDMAAEFARLNQLVSARS